MILLAASIIFLFTLFSLSKDDFVLMRRNVSQRMIFDIAFVGGIVGLFVSRLVYVFMHPSSAYLNPLVFLVIPYFPGLATSGFILGLYATVYAFVAQRKLPKGKVFDIFAMSLIASGETIFVLQAAVEMLHNDFFLIGSSAGVFIILMFLYILLRKLMLFNRIKDGSVALIGLACLALVIVLAQGVSQLFRM